MFWRWHLKHLQHVCLRLLSPQDFPDIIIEEPFSHNNYWTPKKKLSWTMKYPNDVGPSFVSFWCFGCRTKLFHDNCSHVATYCCKGSFQDSSNGSVAFGHLSCSKILSHTTCDFFGETCRPWYFHLALTPKKGETKTTEKTSEYMLFVVSFLLHVFLIQPQGYRTRLQAFFCHSPPIRVEGPRSSCNNNPGQTAGCHNEIW